MILRKPVSNALACSGRDHLSYACCGSYVRRNRSTIADVRALLLDEETVRQG
jgi:hypothetical protein